MPYILKKDRPKFEKAISTLLSIHDKVIHVEIGMAEFESVVLSTSRHISLTVKNEGDLNYVMSSFLWRLFDEKPSYDTANRITDALNLTYDHLSGIDIGCPPLLTFVLIEMVKACEQDLRVKGVIRDVEHEFYRRKVSAYEDGKIANQENGDINV